MTIVNELIPGRSLPAPIVVQVKTVDWYPEESRQAEIGLTDTAGNRLRLIDYEGADLSINWKLNHQYRISQCSVQKGGGGYNIELAPSKKTQIEPLGLTDSTTQILFVGDTHVGRTKHPDTGEKISPRHAFKSAIEYGIDRNVDAVFHVGDIFHESATATHADYIDKHVFAPLEDGNIPFYYIRGNHASSPGDELLEQRDGDLVTNLGSDGVTVNSHVGLFGINHIPDGEIPKHLVTFPNHIPEPLSILVLHQTIGQLSGHSSETVDLEQITRHFGEQFDFILSGHHHDAFWTDWGGTQVMYTGAAEHMSTNDDPDDRVVWLLSADGNSIGYERYDIP